MGITQVMPKGFYLAESAPAPELEYLMLEGRQTLDIEPCRRKESGS